MLGLRLSITLLLAAACLLVTAGFSSASLPEKTAVTCGDYKNVQRLKCDSGVISVQAALFGRTNIQTCSERKSLRQLRNTRCSQRGTVDVVRRRCEGRRVCELNIRAICAPDPCRGTYKYLQTTYTCVPNIRSVTCENSEANLQCGEGKVIFVLRALYGRRDRSTCSFGRSFPRYRRRVRRFRNTFRHITGKGKGKVRSRGRHRRRRYIFRSFRCTRYTSRHTSRVARRCNGKNSCSIQASNRVFGDPCRTIYKYLDMTYRCQYA